jgi:hypothetical protein
MRHHEYDSSKAGHGYLPALCGLQVICTYSSYLGSLQDHRCSSGRRASLSDPGNLESFTGTTRHQHIGPEITSLCRSASASLGSFPWQPYETDLDRGSMQCRIGLSLECYEHLGLADIA